MTGVTLCVSVGLDGNQLGAFDIWGSSVDGNIGNNHVPGYLNGSDETHRLYFGA